MQKTTSSIAEQKAELLLLTAQLAAAKLIATAKIAAEELVRANALNLADIENLESTELLTIAKIAAEKLANSLRTSLVLNIANEVVKRNQKFITEHPIN